MERWPSGLRRTLGKCVYEQSYRGFESHLPTPVAVPLTVLHAFKKINANKLNTNIVFRITNE